jgi:integrase/recombinase XerD
MGSLEGTNVVPALRYATQARGWKQLSTGVTDKMLAGRIEAMWERLAREFRAWDLLEPVLDGRQDLGALFDLWEQSKHNIHEVRRFLADCDIEPTVAEWFAVYTRKHPDTESPAHAIAHVRALLPEGQPRNVSAVTTAWLTEQLYAYPGATSTLRKVHASWSVFFEFCIRVRGLFATNPMAAVEKPELRKVPIQFYELDAVRRIVEAQPDPARRALFALLYGTGAEVSVALELTRADVDPTTREIRAAGTKTHTRDRIARVSEWAWPIFWAYAKDHLPTARLWRESLTRFTVSDWHRATVKGLKLPPYPLKNARHHWAVRMLRGGAPVHVVQAQLGHSTAKLTLDTYGRWLPGSEDRALAEAKVAQAEAALTSNHTSNGVVAGQGRDVSSSVAIAAG